MGPNQILDKGMVAETAVPLYSPVVQSGVEHCSLSGDAGDVCGIAQEEVDEDEVNLGRVIRIRWVGMSRFVAAGEIALRARLAANDDGTLREAVAGEAVVGICVTPTNGAGEWGDVFLTPGVVA